MCQLQSLVIMKPLGSLYDAQRDAEGETPMSHALYQLAGLPAMPFALSWFEARQAARA